MRFNTSLLIVGVTIAAVAAGGYGYYLTSARHSGGSAEHFGTAAMPAGITLEPTGAAQGYEAIRLLHPARADIVYANDKGQTLYTYDQDTPDKSNCTGDCAKSWLPAAPWPNAKPVEGWTLIDRDDGSKQWALKGKPLYTFFKDKQGGDVAGARAASAFGALFGVKTEKAVVPEGWHIAMFQAGFVPTTGITPPVGLVIKEVTDANGVVLVDAREMAVYAYDGDVNNDRRTCANTTTPCGSQFTPLSAPQLAEASGDWSIVERNDEINQWAYKGKPLYTYDDDLVVGDVNGGDVDKRWHVAAIQRYYMPSNVTIQHNPRRGKVWATADGRTLYRREGNAWTNGAHQFVHDIPYRPAVGRQIRGQSCGVECLKTWHPYLAPADAEPNGYWGLTELPDGKKQWTYKDYALFTYDGDKKPGDMTGDDIYDVIVSDDPNKVNDVGTFVAGPAALYWTFASL